MKEYIYKDGVIVGEIDHPDSVSQTDGIGTLESGGALSPSSDPQSNKTAILALLQSAMDAISKL